MQMKASQPLPLCTTLGIKESSENNFQPKYLIDKKIQELTLKFQKLTFDAKLNKIIRIFPLKILNIRISVIVKKVIAMVPWWTHEGMQSVCLPDVVELYSLMSGILQEKCQKPQYVDIIYHGLVGRCQDML